MSVDLQQFCDPSRGNLATPWSDDEFTYATNGHVGIRVPRRVDVERTDGPNIKVLIVRAEAGAHLLGSLPILTLPAPLKGVDCEDCGGTGQAECPHCGHMGDCEECDGTGKGEMPLETVEIAPGVIIQRCYYHLLQTLSGVMIETSPRPADVDPYKAIPFRFDGGDGLVMPCRPHGGTHHALPKEAAA